MMPATSKQMPAPGPVTELGATDVLNPTMSGRRDDCDQQPDRNEEQVTKDAGQRHEVQADYRANPHWYPLHQAGHE